MCGRFVSASDPEGLARFFVVDGRQAEPLEPRYNVAPTQPVYAVVEHGGRRHLVTFRWGLIPSWAEDLRIGSKLINARTETVREKPAFRESFLRRRCLIAADGFYEWQRRDDTRVPYFIRPADGAPMAFAGLWSTWLNPDDGAVVRSCTILTTPAVSPVSELHDRMPVILPPSRWDLWLDRGVFDSPALRAFLESAAADHLRAYPVGPEVNSPHNDHPGLVTPV